MQISLSCFNHSDSGSIFKNRQTDSPKFTLNRFFEDQQSRASPNDFPVSELELKPSEDYLEQKIQKKNCEEKSEIMDFEALKHENEKIENESLLIFQGQLNAQKEVPVPETFQKENQDFFDLKKKKQTKKDLVFEHLKKLDFDEEEPKERETQRKDLQFDMFLKSATSQNLKSVESQSTRFNFNSMNLKSQRTVETQPKPADMKSNLCYQIFTSLRRPSDPVHDRDSLNSALKKENHVNLKRVCGGSSNFQSSYNQFLQTRQRRSKELGCLAKKDEPGSMKSTGLRRKDVVFGDFKTPGRKKTKTVAFVNLASLLEQTPELAREKEKIFGYINQSLRSISMQNVFSPGPKSRKKISQTSLRKGSKIRLFDQPKSPMTPRVKLAKRSFDLFAETPEVSSDKKSDTEWKYEAEKKKSAKKKKTHSRPKNVIKKMLSKIKKSGGKEAKKCGCRCKKTNCTRLHCICFRERGYCGDHCSCTNCFNREEYSDTIKKIRDFTKEINPLAFQSKIDSISFENGQKIHNRGCSCSKNQCQKNYCECFKNGLACSPLCKCENCKNDKVSIEVGKVKEIFKKCSRKKKKFVIFLNKEKPTIKKIQI